MASVKQRIGPAYDRIAQYAMAELLLLQEHHRVRALTTDEQQRYAFCLDELHNWVELRREQFAPTEG